MSTEIKRDKYIDILKCIAALVITWSHMELQFGQFSALATGGSFGDCLFFFCSGYTLFLSSKKTDFLNWYKRRICRIYPTVFAWSLVNVVLYSSNWGIDFILTQGGGFFVSCIMLFYLLIYPIMKYFQKYLWWVMVVVFIACSIAYFFVNHTDYDAMYRWTWSMYFMPMLLGGIMGKAQKEGKLEKLKSMRSWSKIVGLAFSAVCYYLLMFLISRNASNHLLYPLVILPQLGVVYFFYAICNSSLAEKAYNNYWMHFLIMWIGGMCLEIYIVQPRLLQAFPMTEFFPLNILMLFAMIFICAYGLKILSRIWAQTFNDADYSWKVVLKLY